MVYQPALPGRKPKARISADDEVLLASIHPRAALATHMAKQSLSSNALAGFLGVPTNRISEILNMRRALTADTAIRLAAYFPGTTAEFWMNQQAAYDLKLAELESGNDIRREIAERKR